MTERSGLLQQHRTLTFAMERLRRLACVRPSGVLDARATAQVALALSDFSRDMLAHFELEERGGYMAAVLREHPHLMHQVRTLAADHPRLEARLVVLIRRCSEPLGTIHPAEFLAAFSSELESHEQRETQLLQDAWCVDHGAAD